LCGCGDDRHFSIKQPLLLTPHLSSSPKQTQKEKENNTKKKIKEKTIISASFVFVYPPLPPSSSDTIILCRTASPITKLRDLFAPDGEADGGGAQCVPTVHHLPSGSRPEWGRVLEMAPKPPAEYHTGYQS
jgi:hypothetical protein